MAFSRDDKVKAARDLKVGGKEVGKGREGVVIDVHESGWSRDKTYGVRFEPGTWSSNAQILEGLKEDDLESRSGWF